MIEFAVDCKRNAIEFHDPTVQDVAYRYDMEPGSYTIRISDGAYSPFANGDDAEPSIMLWFLNDDVSRVPRHRDRSTNVFTHSQFRSLAGMGDTVSIDVFRPTFMYAFWFDEYGPDNTGVVELTIERDQKREMVSVNAANHSVSWFPGSNQDHVPATIDLKPGQYTLRIERGEWSFFEDGRAAEPFVMLWIAGGRQADLKTGIETPITVRTLNGFGDSLVIDVIETTTVRTFFLDSNPTDNSGSVYVRILEQHDNDSSQSALILDGQSEHSGWKGLSDRLKSYLQDTNLFRVDHIRSVRHMPPLRLLPNFSNYDVVVLNYSSQVADGDFTTRHELRRWPAAVEAAFKEYVNLGGGVVVVHSSNNSFPYWPEYNQITGLGGWYGREPLWGPYVYYKENEVGELELVRDPAPENNICGGHPMPPKPFLVDVQDSSHPIMAGLPTKWLHATDELYTLLRGPAQNMEILATGFNGLATGGNNGHNYWEWNDGDDLWKKPTERHEPLIMTVRYGAGRIFHTVLGHTDINNDDVMFKSVECVGFITIFQRGTEWAATGAVTQDVPNDFPTEDDVSIRPFGE